ncbi:MAG TPA: TolC family protein, partial [Firmicutes bacterium]|nr:TolC family protein [Bacillota bacterium]
MGYMLELTSAGNLIQQPSWRKDWRRHMRITNALMTGLALVLCAYGAAAGQSQAIEVPAEPPDQAPRAAELALAADTAAPAQAGESAGSDSATPAAPADTAPPILSLNEVIELGLARNPGLQALDWQAWGMWSKAQGVGGHGGLDARLAVTSMLTNSPLGVFGSRLSQGRVTQADFDPTVLNDPDYLGNTELKLSLMYPLYDAGRSGLGKEALEYGSRAIEFQQLAAGQQLVGTLVQTYFGNALLTDQLVVLDQASATADELWRMITSLQREGLVTRSDVAAAEVELANIQHQITQARARLTLTETTLNTLTGVDHSFATSVPDIYGVVEMPDLEEITALAIEEHPDICSARSNAVSAGLMLSEARRQRQPTIGLFAETKHSTPGFNDDGHGESTFGAMLQFNLDTNGIISDTIEERDAMEQSALWYLEQVEESVRLGVAASYADLVIANQAVDTFAAQSEK